ncbi:MAG TPA: substrate-binding domain-containing protein [Accumulibacter sp.]|nr:substrate-binding domain-containing protein [Accumulibacter sp.]HMW18239.1 substrate-binding domain-containing protein [Accumulibacter sp.]HMX22937.1 substrate-binding domain-containing protein [Accumulibacter sp.]HMY05777.1 substrate-binding domain-containing protein [Accumulibacter sp.]HNC16904.1 substrate-binding domain-containing protein [Accumulibacter sp.]
MKKMLLKFLVLLSALASAVAAHGGEEIRIGGGGAAMIAVFQPVKPHFEKATGISLINLQSSPKGGLLNLLEGRVDLSAAAHSLDSILSALAKDGMSVDKSQLIEHRIGSNRITVIVHPSNHVPQLSREQVKGIFTGRIGNWQDVGGDNREILVVWGRGTPGQNNEFITQVLDGEPITKDALESSNYNEIKDTVAATPEAVGINPLSVADSTIRVVDTDAPLSTPIVAVTRGKPSAKVRKLLEYLSGEGRAYISQ